MYFKKIKQGFLVFAECYINILGKRIFYIKHRKIGRILILNKKYKYSQNHGNILSSDELDFISDKLKELNRGI